MKAYEGKRSATAGLMVPWGTLTICLAIVTLTSLGTLVVTTSVQGTDALSTIALALAVLSFAAQLIVTMAQGYQASQLNADTKSALADMRATTTSLLTNQRDQFDKVLQAALSQAIPAAVEDVGSPDGVADDDPLVRATELESALRTRIDEALATQKNQPSSQPRQRWHERTRERNRLLASYPSREEGEHVVEVIRTLPSKAIAMLGRISADLAKSDRADGTATYVRSTNYGESAADALIEAGLVRMVSESAPNKDGKKQIRVDLTPDGWIAARLLRAVGEAPPWAAVLDKA